MLPPPGCGLTVTVGYQRPLRTRSGSLCIIHCGRDHPTHVSAGAMPGDVRELARSTLRRTGPLSCANEVPEAHIAVDVIAATKKQ
jgi:hypothetical protein